MIIWRLCKARYSKQLLSGEGARLNGGRWSYPGTAVVYTAGTLSLAVLELLVHLDYEVAPADMVKVQILVPSSASIEKVKIESLPKNWRNYPAPESLQKIGSSWAMGKRSLLLEVPSAVIPEERNYLVNPEHPDFKVLKVERLERFKLDSRLFKSQGRVWFLVYRNYQLESRSGEKYGKAGRHMKEIYFLTMQADFSARL